jgi:hypothetical protein
MKRGTGFALVVALMMALAAPESALAYVVLGHKLTYGVGNYGKSTQHYYVTSTASKYAAWIDQSMYDWVHTTARLRITTPISYTQTTDSSASRMDVWAGTYYGADTGIAGETFFIKAGKVINPAVSDWTYGKIQLNTPVFSNLGTSDKKGTTAHEMGHVMGLNENNRDPKSVMCQLGSGRVVYNAQADDANGINKIY